METLVLEKYVLNAEKAFEDEKFFDGLKYLEDALSIEPYYSKAHNHMGWVYLHKINKYKKAELHLRLALREGNVYGPAYIHLAYILFEGRKFTELEKLLQEAMDTNEVDASFIYNEFGRINEVRGRFRKAIGCYKQALYYSFDDKEIDAIKENIQRCRKKRRILYF